MQLGTGGGSARPMPKSQNPKTPQQHIIRTKLILGINKIKYHRLLREN